jgi:hypothetical protein
VSNFNLTHKDTAFGNMLKAQRKKHKMLIRIKWNFRWGKKRVKGEIVIRFRPSPVGRVSKRGALPTDYM